MIDLIVIQQFCGAFEKKMIIPSDVVHIIYLMNIILPT